MRALVWIVDDTWQATVAAAAELLPPGADVTLLHVAAAEAEQLAEGARHGLLGRRRPGPPAPPLRAVSAQAAEALLEAARGALGRPAQASARRGRVEREVVAAAQGMALLVLARAGDRPRRGPRSRAPAPRFVAAPAPCRVLLVGPARARALQTIPPH